MRPAAGGDTSASALAKRELLSRCSACRTAVSSPAACETRRHYLRHTGRYYHVGTHKYCRYLSATASFRFYKMAVCKAGQHYLRLRRSNGDADSQGRGQQCKQGRQQRLVRACPRGHTATGHTRVEVVHPPPQ